MHKLSLYLIFTLLVFACSALAVDNSSLNADPAATCGNTTYSQADVFGDIISTIPSTNPGPSNAWVGNTYMNAELIQAKNVYPSTVPSQMVRINPSTGAIIATVNLPFNGYVIGFTNDGTDLWVVQWSPSNMVYKVSIAGAQLASWPPNVSPYSARSAAFEGGFLWIGCDQSSNNTKLVKFSTAGANTQEWTTGTAVGWYMDAEFSNNAPAGANLYVVDNVGNTLKRLAVGVSVTVAAQVASPAGSPDVAEGLGFDGEYLWHNGAYASQSLVWKLDDGFPGLTINVEIDLVPLVFPISIPASGGSFSFFAFVTNPGSTTYNTTLWTAQRLPNGSMVAPLMGPYTITLSPGTRAWFRSQNVPGSAAPGNYMYFGYAGTYPNVIMARDSIPYTKLTTGDGGWVGDWNNYGDPFPGEEAISPQPSAFNLIGATPNPFNPTTTLSFSLPEAVKVSLNVYDVQGRLVAQLVNGLREVGTHQVTFDGSNLASGMYLYRLTAGSNHATGKMVLMK
jgi:hypothetical protein